MKKDDIELWRWREVKRRVGFGRTTIWMMVKERRFPAPYRIGKQIVAWRADEVLAWMRSRKKTA